MPVLRNIGYLARCLAGGGQGEIHPVRDAALAWREGTIRWSGPESELPPPLRDEEDWDAGGTLVVPGLVDCHTHLAFGGWRAREYELRLRGASYREIAESGGGIASTMESTRRLSEEELTARSATFLAGMRRLGVTTVEGKSGYGLSLEHELRQLRAYRRLDRREPERIVATFLGAHVVPPEYDGRRDEYVALLVEQMIPRVAEEGLASCCDVFVEKGAFSVEEGRRVLAAGSRHGLSPRLHADQLGDGGGAELAADVGALSADHLEHVSERGIQALADADVTAVSLPLSALYLDAPYMPARRFVEAGVRVAVGTDFNPGSAPSYHLPLALLLACNRQKLLPSEALKAATIYAAAACGVDDRAGSLEEGKGADFALMDAGDPTGWLYHFREGSCLLTVAGGRVTWRSPRAGDAGVHAPAASGPGGSAGGSRPRN